MKFELDPKTALKYLLGFTAFLLFMNTFGVITKHFLGNPRIFGLVFMFDFASERNVPTLFSSFSLATAGLLLSLIAASHRRAGEHWGQWATLALVFLFLSLDEVAEIHERLIDPVRNTLHASGVLFFAWIIPYGLALIALAAIYLRFLLRLPRETMKMFLVSGLIYVSGAVGLEMAGGMHFETHGNDFLYAVFYTFEELFEMLGVALFIYALLGYVAGRFGSLSVTVTGHRNANR